MTSDEIFANMHRRMDAQDRMLIEIRDRMIDHIARQNEIKPALDELVSLWKGSKIIIPMFATLAAGIWAIMAWGKDHVKW